MLHEIILLSIIHESVKRIEVRGAEMKRIVSECSSVPCFSQARVSPATCI